MLSIGKSTNAAWRSTFQSILPSKHDIDNDIEVREAFAKGMAWADQRRKELPDSPYRRCLEHKDKPSDYYANQYLRTRTLDGGPIIPNFMRAYCAHEAGWQVTESQKPTGAGSTKTERSSKRKAVPLPIRRSAPAYA